MSETSPAIKIANTTINSTNEGTTSSKTVDRPEGKGTVAMGSTRTGTQTDYSTTETSTATRTTTGTQSTIRMGVTMNQRQ